MAAAALHFSGLIDWPAASNSLGAPVAWRGLALGGRWERTAFSIRTNALISDPQSAPRVWAATDDGVWTTTNGGATWSRAGLPGVSLASLGLNARGATVFAGGFDGTAYSAVRTHDGARSWHPIGLRLGSDHPIFTIAPAQKGQTVLAGTFGGLYRGEEVKGRWTWQVVYRTGDASVTSILWIPWEPNRVLAAAFGTSPPVVSSADGGRTWKSDATALPSTLPTQALIAPTVPSRQVILTTMGGGVWREIGGQDWSDISDGLPAHHAMPIVAVHAHRLLLLYAGTMGFGVYARQGDSSWRPLGTGPTGGQYTSLGLALTYAPGPTLLVATALGVFRYVPSS
jgi:hypothetical protein